MKRKIFIGITIVVVLALVGVITGVSFYMLNYSLSAQNNKRDEAKMLEGVYKANTDLRPWLDSLKASESLRDTFITMSNGERQHAMFVRSANANGRTALLVHGYSDNCIRMIDIASIYNRQLGFNIILPDLHAHGKSDGDDIQMGWKDRLDILHWIAVAEKMFASKGHDSQMVLHGVSMGAATTMNVSGEDTPAYLRCFVEDCGYTSVWDEFSQELKNRFHLSDFPIMYSSSALCKLRYGWSFGEASPLKQVAKCHKPMLFIHGSNDTFVPTAMVHPLYAAKPQPKELWIAPGSEHARSYSDHKKEYTQRVCNFVNKYVKAD